MIHEKNYCADCYPGFTVICKCGSKNVYTEDSRGWSETSGGWGSLDLVCDDCGNRIALCSND